MNSYTARRTPVHRGTAAWSAILPGQPAPVTLDGDLTVDFALVGGGFAGLSTALHAAEAASDKPAPELVRRERPGVDETLKALKTARKG
mgnify:CR=1 FL=1